MTGEMSTDEIASTYDQFTYDADIHPTIHPVRLSTAGLLRGVAAAPIGTCRVLEFGCALATDLILLADAYPDATLIGLEISERQVELANQRIADLDLSNISVRHADIAEPTTAIGHSPRRNLSFSSAVPSR